MKRLLTFILVAAVIMPAWAQDGGQDSPLSSSQGVRALGSGGAVSAWLDEASALWWNPATLLGVSRKQLELQHTENALDTRTNHFAFAYPTLDAGTWAVGAVLQTTGDINVTGPLSPAVLGTESFNRFRIGAAYAFALPYGVDVGTTFKFVGYRFAGTQRGAWGLDLGIVPWRQGKFRAGAAVQNLIPPTFSFADDLEDKWSRRGLLSVALQSERWVISVQAEVAQRETARFRLGGEAKPASAVALRAGFDGDAPTVGAGIRYRSLRVDYAFVSPSDLGTEHRFGLSFDIGPSVEVQRQRRDRQAETRVLDELQRQRDEQRGSLEGRADSLMKRGRWEDAARAYAQLLLLFPGEARFESRLSDIARLRDSLTSARIDSAIVDRAGDEREQVLRDLLQAQLRAGAWPSAIGTADALLSFTSDSESVRSQRALATDSLQAEAEQALTRSRSALRRGAAADAAGWARVALLHVPEFPEATRALRRAERLGSRQAAEAALLEAEASGDTTQILSRAQDLLALEPQHPFAQRRLSELAPQEPASEAGRTIEELKADSEAWDWYTRGFVEFRAGRYEEAISWWERILERYPTNEATLKNVEQARLRLDSDGGDE